ncbi:hypothetical protein [Anaerolentibacter hominis]|uniref:hypothetical protein n=1 Tax=Anaerolentibacter hominis TaxID=3079009 RepID=UPI0031B82073
MKHTYFYNTQDWRAEGTYFDEEGQEFPLYGEVSVIHSEEQWSLDGFLEVTLQTPVRFTNKYSIHESELPSTLQWESYNPALGTLKGTFEIIGSSIISFYTSEDGMYSGTETLVQVSPEEYYNAGVSFCYGRKMSSWTARLKGCKLP